jgi:gelsolin
VVHKVPTITLTRSIPIYSCNFYSDYFTYLSSNMSENRVPWQESNLAGIGSDLDKKIREAAAENEQQWDDIGQQACLKVWRIEQFKVVEWPESKYGRFHEGDTYVVLNSYVEGEDDPKLLHDVHIWIGSQSSQDEYGTAAYKMVECDDSLGGIAVQHREVQGCESDMFKGYFGGCLMFLSGGIESGFYHVEATVDEPLLYKVKGTENAMSLTQHPVECASLNSGDCFVLACGKEKVFLWNGENVSITLFPSLSPASMSHPPFL